MDFLQSNTMLNLARAFAGETQARTRYRFYGNKIREEGYEYMYKLISQIAYNEYAHAQIFFGLIKKHAGKPLDNIHFDAGYPFQIAATPENLIFAAEGENSEAQNIYPSFAKIAGEEGFTDAERSFTQIAQIESYHNKVFTTLNKKLTSGTLYKSDMPVEWECSFCGYKQSGASAFEKCPVCGKPQGWVKINIC